VTLRSAIAAYPSRSPEGTKRALDEVYHRAGVEVFLHAFLRRVDRIEAVAALRRQGELLSVDDLRPPAHAV
jgi:hypothetical protein